MEGYLTYYYEYHFLYITGIEHVESKSIQGAAFDEASVSSGHGHVAGALRNGDRLRESRPRLHAAGHRAARSSCASTPAACRSATSFSPAKRKPHRRPDAGRGAESRCARFSPRLPGVSAPPPFGGSARTIVVNVKPDRLRAYNLSPDEIVQAMSQANTISPSGNMNLGDKYPIVPVNAVVKNIKDLEGVPLRVTASGAVFLRDVATVEDAADIVTSYALVNGRRTVYLPVTKRADASTLTVVELVKKNIPKFQSVVPDDIKVTYEFDQSPYVTAPSAYVGGRRSGRVLTGLMVLLFLRDWRSAFDRRDQHPAVAPRRDVRAFDQRPDHQPDDAGRPGAGRRHPGGHGGRGKKTSTHVAGRSLARAVVDSAGEVAVPLLLAMLCVLAVFVPAFFMTGTAKAMFLPLALAVGFSMITSYLLASTLVPILVVWLGKRAGEPAVHEAQAGRFERFRERYARFMRWVVAVRGVHPPVSLADTIPYLRYTYFQQIRPNDGGDFHRP